jgi:hypothetical protein
MLLPDDTQQCQRIHNHGLYRIVCFTISGLVEDSANEGKADRWAASDVVRVMAPARNESHNAAAFLVAQPYRTVGSCCRLHRTTKGGRR